MKKKIKIEKKELGTTYIHAGFVFNRVLDLNGYTVFQAEVIGPTRPIYEVYKGKYKVSPSNWGTNAWTFRSLEGVMNKVNS